MSDELRNEWGPRRRPRIKSWVARSSCRIRGHLYAPLRMTWSERRPGSGWIRRSSDNGGEWCSRCGLGRVSLTFVAGEGTVWVDDVRAVDPMAHKNPSAAP